MIQKRRIACSQEFFIVLLVLLATTDTTLAEVVYFPDANLESVIRKELGISEPIPITDADMETMELLQADREDISNIHGLQYATNLQLLLLWGNDIDDISVLPEMTNLNALSLDRNPLSDISPLSGMTNLRSLSLSWTQINDLAPLSGLTDLIWLDLNFNRIGNLSSLSGLTKLNSLHLENNRIGDISALSGMTKMKWLFLSGNRIDDVSPLSRMTGLVFLHLENNQIATMDISGAKLSSLRQFNITGNPLKKVILANATLSRTAFETIMNGGTAYYTGIAELQDVSHLDMSGADFADLSDLSSMYAMDDLQELLMVGARNLNGSNVVALVEELDSLNRLDVTGLWDSFDVGTQASLRAWDAIAGHTLVVPEPAALSMLLILGALTLMKQGCQAILPPP